MITRTIHKRIEEHLFRGKIIILYGARRVGKTTLAIDTFPDLQIIATGSSGFELGQKIFRFSEKIINWYNKSGFLRK